MWRLNSGLNWLLYLRFLSSNSTLFSIGLPGFLMPNNRRSALRRSSFSLFSLLKGSSFYWNKTKNFIWKKKEFYLSALSCSIVFDELVDELLDFSLSFDELLLFFDFFLSLSFSLKNSFISFMGSCFNFRFRSTSLSSSSSPSFFRFWTVLYHGCSFRTLIIKINCVFWEKNSWKFTF